MRRSQLSRSAERIVLQHSHGSLADLGVGNGSVCSTRSRPQWLGPGLHPRRSNSAPTLKAASHSRAAASRAPVEDSSSKESVWGDRLCASGAPPSLRLITLAGGRHCAHRQCVFSDGAVVERRGIASARPRVLHTCTYIHTCTYMYFCTCLCFPVSARAPQHSVLARVARPRVKDLTYLVRLGGIKAQARPTQMQHFFLGLGIELALWVGPAVHGNAIRCPATRRAQRVRRSCRARRAPARPCRWLRRRHPRLRRLAAESSAPA